LRPHRNKGIVQDFFEYMRHRGIEYTSLKTSAGKSGSDLVSFDASPPIAGQLFDRHPVDAGTSRVLSNALQCGPKVLAFARLLHQVATS
jgi:hypothetical protein